MADDRRERDQARAVPDGEIPIGNARPPAPLTDAVAPPHMGRGPWPPPHMPQSGQLPQSGPWPSAGSPWQAVPPTFQPPIWSVPYPSAWPPQRTGWPPQQAPWPPYPSAVVPPPQATWPIGYVPWGYSNPPAVPPVLEAPEKFHPPAPERTLLSLRGRVSPSLYAAGLVLGVPGLLALLFLEAAPRAGWKLGLAELPAWILVEAVCVVAAAGLAFAAIAQSRQRREDGWQDYVGPSPFLLMAVLLAVVTGVTLPLARGLTAAGVDADSAAGTMLLLLVYLGTYLGLVHLLAVRPGSLSWRDVVRPRHLAPAPDDWASATPEMTLGGAIATPARRWSSRIAQGSIGDILLALAMLLPVLFASGVLNQALAFVLGLTSRDLSPPVPTSTTGLDPWMTLFAVAVIVPVGEEVFFRGFATNAWGRSLARNSAILRAALFFAFIHILNVSSTEPGLALRMAAFNFGARIPVAIALTWLYFRRRSILATGTLHASYNGLIQLLSMLIS